MDRKTSGNDFAFPSTPDFDDGGLTKREYFAAVALQGLLANPGFNENPALDDAKAAVQIADALIARLNEA